VLVQISFISHPLLKENAIERRLYQETLTLSCINHHSLVILPTGLGKTIIAALIAAYRKKKHPKGKIIFLAPTKPLVDQHHKTFTSVFNFDASDFAVLTGSTPPGKRKEIWMNSSFIFVTPQTLQNDIIKGNCSLEDCVFLIFDEAHRAVGNYAYVFIAREYIKQARNPLILGITASPSSEEIKIQEIQENLFIQNIEIRTESSPDVKDYVQPVEIEKIFVSLPSEFMDLKSKIESELKAVLMNLKRAGIVDTYDLRRISHSKLLAAQRMVQARIKDSQPDAEFYENIKRITISIKLSHMLELLESQGLISLQKYLKKIQRGTTKSDKIISQSSFYEEMFQLIQRLMDGEKEHPKLKKLITLLNNEIKRNPDAKIIVFVHYRVSAQMITAELEKHEQLRAVRFVGQQSKRGDKGLTQKEQLEILEQFKAGDYNLLIATSVAEEGLDISECDLVIFYDSVPSSIRSIQRRGRTGRKRAGKVIVLITKGTIDEGYHYAAQSKERTMKRHIRELQHYSKQLKEKLPNDQKSLITYVPETPESKKKKITIIADTRETASPVVRTLYEAGVDVQLKKLDVGDYIISEDAGIERKTIEDLAESLKDGRLFRELTDLCNSYSIPIIIIEGTDLYSARGIVPNALRGTLASLILDFKLATIFSKDAEDTAKFLIMLAKREQEEKKKTPRIRNSKTPPNMARTLEYIVAGIPLIDITRARNLLSHFGSIKNIFTASEEELRNVKGIGEKIARQIILLFNEEYQDDGGQ